LDAVLEVNDIEVYKPSGGFASEFAVPRSWAWWIRAMASVDFRFNT